MILIRAHVFQFIYMLLSKHPSVFQKVRDEHTKVFGNCTATPDILRKTANKLNELVYTAAVIHETLRLFPVGFSVRAAEESTTLTHRGTTYPIGQGLVVIPNPHTIHYDSTNFKDPAEFIPERFMEEGSVSRKMFRTFGRGPRACLGQNLAIDELRIILLLTAREYDFECIGLKPNSKPKTAATKMDTIFGDVVFQELGLEAKPRGRVMMKVKKRIIE
jgi:cytochrome P450